jgi:lysophospholipase L1-like esterase
MQRMVVLGDSVPWGQGLLEEHKFHTLVQKGLGGSIAKDVIAHSGATIGVRTTRTGKADGEVPISYPTIVQQCDEYSNAPEQVDLVLLNGGINDIDIRTILNPFTDEDDLSDDIRKYCYLDMKTLLGKVLAKFTKAKIVLTGYYPIISKQSHPLRILPFLDILGIGFPSGFYVDPIFEKIAALSIQFWKESDQQLARAVTDTDGGRIIFVPAPFTEANSVFTDDPWLFALNADLSPQDEVIAARENSCDLYFDEPLDLVSREQCHRASAGHPNVTGSRNIAEAVLRALGSN